MRKIVVTLAAVSALALGACQSKEADRVEDKADAQSDMLEAKADTMLPGAASDAVESKADAVEAAGEARADAIDNGAVPPPAPAVTR